MSCHLSPFLTKLYLLYPYLYAKTVNFLAIATEIYSAHPRAADEPPRAPLCGVLPRQGVHQCCPQRAVLTDGHFAFPPAGVYVYFFRFTIVFVSNTLIIIVLVFSFIMHVVVVFLLFLVPFFRFKFVLRSEEHTSELQSRFDLVCRLL